jgi:hypothetical protein
MSSFLDERYLILLGVSGETVVTPRSRNAYASLWRRSAPSTSATVRPYWPATWVTVFRKRCSACRHFLALPRPSSICAPLSSTTFQLPRLDSVSSSMLKS